jgi:Na+-translocating ferredoxin:NAD+ oxidoreductase subunit B
MLDAIEVDSPSGAAANLADRIDAVLPQTQCAKCGFAGCRPYAEAIATRRAEINQCPPGGAAGIAKLSSITGRPVLPLNPENGNEAPLRVAVIDEELCIGCTLCIQACPVDAIVGAAKRMHTVLAPLCTGCDLCIPPCPMDCITMLTAQPPRGWSDADALAARSRFEARNRRLARERVEAEERRHLRAIAKSGTLDIKPDVTDPETNARKARVAAAIERARARRKQQVEATGSIRAPETER